MIHKKAKKPFRFALVGILNTLVDISIYTFLSHLGWAVLIANTISTSCGMLLSFFLNRNFTFNAPPEGKRRQVILFLAVTLVSQWIIQPIIIFVTSTVIDQLHLVQIVAVIIAKCCAILVSLIWNYWWYSRIVFATRNNHNHLSS